MGRSAGGVPQPGIGRFLPGMVIGQRVGLQRFEREVALLVMHQQDRRHPAQGHAPFDGLGGHAEPHSDVVGGGPACRQIAPRLELVGGVHGKANHVLGQRHLCGCLAGLNDAAWHGLALGPNTCLHHRPQGKESALPRYQLEAVFCAGPHGEWVEKAMRRYGRRQFVQCHGRPGPADIARLRRQLTQSDILDAAHWAPTFAATAASRLARSVTMANREDSGAAYTAANSKPPRPAFTMADPVPGHDPSH